MSSRQESTLPQKGWFGLSGMFIHTASSISRDERIEANDIWSKSGLEFTSLGISHNISNASEELAASFRTAYTTTLKPYHSFLVKPVFSAAMSATPYRKDFYSKLGDDQAQVEAALRVWLKALSEQVTILKGFLDRKEAKW